jgi:hypothetical protein
VSRPPGGAGRRGRPGRASASGRDDQVRYRYELSAQPDTRAAYGAIMGWVRENGFGYTHDDIRRVTTRTLVVNGKQDVSWLRRD